MLVAGVAGWRREVEKGLDVCADGELNRMPGECDRYEGRRYVASNMLERMTLDALVAILELLMGGWLSRDVVCAKEAGRWMLRFILSLNTKFLIQRN